VPAIPSTYAVVAGWTLVELSDFALGRRASGEFFPPKIGWRLLRALMIVGSVAGIAAGLHDRPPSEKNVPVWVFALLLLFWLLWLRTVRVDSSGVFSSGLFGSFSRAIPRANVARITSDWEDRRLQGGATTLWTFTGTRITVKARDGGEISHGVRNQNQRGFLDALRRHLPAAQFDAGLYDWHP
jgi:hypothetical protein